MSDDTLRKAAVRTLVQTLFATLLFVALVRCCTAAPANPPSHPVLAEPLK